MNYSTAFAWAGLAIAALGLLLTFNGKDAVPVLTIGAIFTVGSGIVTAIQKGRP